MNKFNNEYHHKLIQRMIRNILFGLLFIISALLMGMLGYHLLEEMTWVDAFANAAMILSGMGPLTSLKTNAGKIFAGFYALFSGLAFIISVSLIFSPMIHQFFKKIHLEDKKKEE